MSKKRTTTQSTSAGKEETPSAEMQMQTIKQILAWQLTKAMKKKKLSKNKLATQMNTSRAQVDRLLDSEANITLSSLVKAATLLGRKVTVVLT